LSIRVSTGLTNWVVTVDEYHQKVEAQRPNRNLSLENAM